MALKAGIIGCGTIAPAYMTGCSKFPEWVQVVACADIVAEKAQNFATQYNLQAQSIDELLTNPEVDIIINLTIPAVHAEVSLQVVEAGKHVYSEKPLALNRADGQRLLLTAQAEGVRVGCAPDTFLGAGGQTCRRVIDEGLIGRPVAATAFLANHGPEEWHPNPFFYYQPGGGPMFDMGPYYLTALINLLGPMRRVSGITSRGFNERVAGAENIRGEAIPVEVTTHSAGTIEFVNGAVATLITSFDVWKHNLPIIEIYGTTGTLSVPDPNRFDGIVRVWQVETGEWRTLDLIGRADVQRGIGVADMARGILQNTPHLASGALALHVLDAMQAFDDSSAEGRHISLQSKTERPPILKL
jgi:predicted dehydrogenase